MKVEGLPLEPLSHSALVIFEMGSPFLPRLAWTSILLFVLPELVGMTGAITQSLVGLGAL
jgi:hypothetical protein